MKHLKRFYEDFNILIGDRERKNFKSDFGFEIEDLEDVLLELSDMSDSRGGCKIKTPNQETRVRYIEDNRIIIKKIPQLIILANITVSFDGFYPQRINTKEEYESIMSSIKRRLSQMNLYIEDTTLEHSETQVDFGIYFVCLRLFNKSDFELLSNKKNSVWTD